VSLPSFFVIGAFRSGTTSLYEYLRQHPQVFLPPEKEPNWLAIDGNPDVDAVLAGRSVRSMEEYQALYAGAEPGQVLGDISPEYLRNPWASRRIRELVPDARLVAILRNPIERAWSDYLLHVRDGNEPCGSFREALEAQQERQAAGDHRAAHYVESGLYGEQLRRYHERFDPEQLLVVLFEEMRDDRDATLARIFDHVGVDPTVTVGDAETYNASGVPRGRMVALALRGRHRLRPYVNRGLIDRARPHWERFLSSRLDRPMLNPDDRAHLARLFAPDIEVLSSLLGRDLSHWLEV
jgi:hypothetical protein